MEEAGIIFRNLVILLLYFGIGMLCRRKRIITEQGVDSFNQFVLNAALPCTIFQSFMMELTRENMETALLLLFLSAGTCLLSFGVGFLFFRKVPHMQQCVMRYSILISNCTFVGLPLMSGLCGPIGVFYTSVFVIPNRFFMWSMGVWLFSKKNSGWKETARQVLLNPCMAACYLGTACLLARIPVPDMISTVISQISACTAPLSMITIGAVLAQVRWKTLADRNAWIISFFRLLFLPLLLWLILAAAGMDEQIILVSVLMTGMPLANTVILLARKYQADVELAGAATLLSMLLSMGTLPLLAVVLR